MAQKFLEQEIAKLTALVARQEELVARLDLDGRDTELAHQVCCSLRDTLRLLEAIRLREVRKGGPTG